MKNVDLIIFDWDDVFTLGSKEGYFQCYHETLVDLGVTLSAEEEKKRILAKWGQPHREELRELLREQPELLDTACSVYEQKLFGSTFTSQLSLVPGAVEVLEQLAKQYKLAIATGLHPRLFREHIVPHFSIPNVFGHVITAYDVEPEQAKPNPYMVQLLLERFDIDSDTAIMVGDSENDMKMAQAAGVTTVAVLTGHMNRAQAEALGVEYIIPSVTDIQSIL